MLPFMSKPVLSIIVPIYKTEKYLKRCVDSILKQSITDFEVILIDDESPDRSPVICDEYAQKDPRVKVIHKKNQGLGMARNSGMQIATGKYLTFLDSDDFVEQNYYENMFLFAEKNGLDLCVAGYYLSDTGQKQKKINTVDKKMLGKIIADQSQINALASKVICPDLNGNDFFSASVCFAIFRSDILINNNLLFDSERNFLSEDLKFSMNLFQYCHRVGVFEEGGYHYWYNSNSLSRGHNPKRFTALKETTQQLEQLCIELKLDNYTNRVALYFWVNFEKCLNQEVRYSLVERRLRILNLLRLCKDDITQKEIGILIHEKGLRGLQKLLCMRVYKKQCLLINFLLELYNFSRHQRKL